MCNGMLTAIGGIMCQLRTPWTLSWHCMTASTCIDYHTVTLPPMSLDCGSVQATPDVHTAFHECFTVSTIKCSPAVDTSWQSATLLQEVLRNLENLSEASICVKNGGKGRQGLAETECVQAAQCTMVHMRNAAYKALPSFDIRAPSLQCFFKLQMSQLSQLQRAHFDQHACMYMFCSNCTMLLLRFHLHCSFAEAALCMLIILTDRHQISYIP